jgi:hypothetical protein
MPPAGTTRLLTAALLLSAVGGFPCPAPARGADDRDGADFFEKRIRPILAEQCYGCHSARAEKLRGGLRLDSRDGLRKGGNSGPAVVPGDPGASLLIKAVRYADPDLRMPPKKRLSAEQVADFEAWVKRGAPDPRMPEEAQPAAHLGKTWAFQPRKEPPLPAVKRHDWVRNAIDRFILARLEEKGLAPAPPADKRALLRRATFDLTGLPPTPAEVEAFLADTSPDAFARVVDRLLASPAYGERWGRHWLDLVRYTDDFDESWRYRDWVVNAFNRDLPYDQFILQQIAGDLLPPDRPGEVNADGIVATTMLSLGPWSGIDHKKRLTDIADDQIDTVGRSVLGLTVACARCHNHKFDPITTADYYGLAGIFFSSHVQPDRAYLSHQTARLRVPLVGPAQVEKHERQLARVREAEEKLQAATDRYYADFARGLSPQAGRYLLASWDYRHRPADQVALSVGDFASKRELHAYALERWLAYLDEPGLGEYKLLHLPVREYDGEAGVRAWMAHAERPWWGFNTNRAEVAIETFTLPPRSVSVNPGTEGGAVGWKSPVEGKVRVAGRVTDGDPFDGVGVAWAVDHVSAAGRRELASGTMPNGGSMRLDQGRNADRLAAVAVKPGDVIYLQVRLREGDAHYDVTSVGLTIARTDSAGTWDLARDVADDLLAANPHRDSQGNAGVWGFYDMAGSHRLERMPAAEPLVQRWRKATGDQKDRAAVEKAAEELQKAVTAAGPNGPLAEDLSGTRSPFHVTVRDDNKYLPAEARAALAKLAGELHQRKGEVPPLPCANGIQEGGIRYSLYPGVQDVSIHIRGRYEQLGERVPRRFPVALAGDRQPPIRLGSGRMELARWLGSPGNPLTARVMVNRIWQHHFGEGIVRTPSNFGAQGERPSHPELLDYLAGRFVASGWSVKAMHRLILLSATYQQSSRATKESRRADPENRLFGRVDARRLEAEALHDGLLAVADRLDGRRGGPADADAASPRRLLYLRKSRSDQAGLGPLFDGANPSMHVDRRSASTVAPQALFLMNSPLVVDAARRLANRPEVAAAKGPEARIQALYRLAYGREATKEEVRVGRDFVEALGRELSPKGPAESAPLGAWETYAQGLLLANEFLFVD